VRRRGRFAGAAGVPDRRAVRGRGARTRHPASWCSCAAGRLARPL